MPDPITLDIPAHLAAAAQATPAELKIELAIHLYTQDRLTLEEASELAEVGMEEFQRVLDSQNISSNQRTTSTKSEKEINKRLVEINQRLSYMFTVLSSEIRTPLTAVRGYTDLLLQGTEPPLNETQQTFVKNISDYADYTLLLWEDIFNLTHIGLGNIYLDFEEIQVSEIIEAVANQLPKHQESIADVSVSLENLPKILADRRWMQAIFRFLMVNNYYGQAAIHIRYDSNHVIVNISSSESTIHLETLEELTKEEVLPVWSTNWNNLWLIPCRYLIEKHGGTLHAENLEGGGSQVTFTLPIRPPEGQRQIVE